MGPYQCIGVVKEIVLEFTLSLIYELVPDNDASQLDYFTRTDINPFYHSRLSIIIILIFSPLQRLNSMLILGTVISHYQ